ncbi:MAG: TRAP transporter large permease, partial [Spirochaetia bacterium]|nr:TRAP transporter large permease [Spirochaetia bacterium]
MITFLLVVFALLLIIGAPIAVALGLSSMLGIQFFGGGSLVTAGQRIFEGMNSFALLAVPLYTFAGLVMGRGGIARRIIDFCYSVVGHIYGGLAHVNVLASMVFAGMSGSAAADTAGVSGMMMPQMVAKKYSREFTVAVTAISSTIGIIIPPSIPMVVIAGILNVSTGKLFLGGIIPGIMLGIAQMIVGYFVAKKENVPREEKKFELKSLWKAFWHSIFALFMPFLIMGSILSGFVSPTEAGVIAALYSLFAGAVIYRELKWNDIKIALLETARTCGKIFILLGAGALFSKLLTSVGFHIAVQNLLFSITTDPTLMLILNLLIILIVTCFMDSIATLTMFMPVLYPVIESVGVDPILFCVLVVVCIGVGLVTPPVGVCLYIACDLMKLKIIPASKALLPFLVVT